MGDQAPLQATRPRRAPLSALGTAFGKLCRSVTAVPPHTAFSPGDSAGGGGGGGSMFGASQTVNTHLSGLLGGIEGMPNPAQTKVGRKGREGIGPFPMCR